MTYRIIPAIMSGGAGTRLWPLSTDAQPKQFHALAGDESLFATTAKRVRGIVGDVSFSPPIVLCNESHLVMARQELGGEAAAFVLEPVPRNTAAVGAIAAAVAAEIDPDALVLLLPADHIVADAAAFHAAIARAAPFARERIVTFGIAPDRPATGYGYIQRGAALGDGVFAIELLSRKAECGDGAAIFVDRRVFVERGHLPVSSRALAGRVRCERGDQRRGAHGAGQRRAPRQRNSSRRRPRSRACPLNRWTLQ